MLCFSLTINAQHHYNQKINVNRMLGTVKELASDKYQGRLPGSKEYFMAANYMIDNHYKALGLKPLGDDNTYFQYVPIEYNEIHSPAKLIIYDKKG